MKAKTTVLYILFIFSCIVIKNYLCIVDFIIAVPYYYYYYFYIYYIFLKSNTGKHFFYKISNKVSFKYKDQLF